MLPHQIAHLPVHPRRLRCVDARAHFPSQMPLSEGRRRALAVVEKGEEVSLDEGEEGGGVDEENDSDEMDNVWG